MITQKPTIVLIPGAWHRPKHYNLLLDKLSSSGYEVHAVTTKSVGAPEPLKNLDPDVAATSDVILPLAEQGKEILVIAHSYGGVVATESLGPLAKKKRESVSRTGGVIGIVYLAAHVLLEGQSLLDLANGEFPEDQYLVKEEYVWPREEVTKSMFYSDVDDKQAEEAISMLESHSANTMKTKLTRVAYVDIPSYYIFCEKDAALPIEFQKGMVTKAQEVYAVEFKSKGLPSGHSPFLNMPEETARIIRTWAGEKL